MGSAWRRRVPCWKTEKCVASLHPTSPVVFFDQGLKFDVLLQRVMFTGRFFVGAMCCSLLFLLPPFLILFPLLLIQIEVLIMLGAPFFLNLRFQSLINPI